jgi:hypothetical protein
MKSIWNEAFVNESKQYPLIFRTTEMPGVLAEIGTYNLSNTSLQMSLSLICSLYESHEI